MTPNGLWRRSFPEVVSIAHHHWAARRYGDAGREYWCAAYVAPTEADETQMLEFAWLAHMREVGLRSEFEISGGR